MNKIIVGLMAVFISGCVIDNRDAIASYRCNQVQWEQVQSETLFCSKETDYSPYLCFRAAKAAYCDFIPLKEVTNISEAQND